MTTETKELKEYTTDEVSKHTSEDDCWLIIGNEMNGTKQENFINVALWFEDRFSVMEKTC